MSLKHAEVVKKFAARTPNRRTGKVEWTGSNVFCDDTTLFSYGRHWPLAVHLGGGRFVTNLDRRSVSTNTHAGLTRSEVPGPRVSFALLKQCGIDLGRLRPESFLDHRPEDEKRVYRRRGRTYSKCVQTGQIEDSSLETHLIDPWECPPHGHLTDFRVTASYESARWWSPATTLLRDGDDFYLFFGRECAVRLPSPAATVAEAERLVTPGGITGFVRRYHWFFVPAEEQRRAEKKKYRFGVPPLDGKHIPGRPCHFLHNARQILSVTRADYVGNRIYVAGRLKAVGFPSVCLKSWHAVHTGLGKWTF